MRVQSRRHFTQSGSGLPPSAKRLERRAQLRREQLRLLPRGEVSAPVSLLEVADIRVRVIYPTARGLPDLAGKRGDTDRQRYLRRSLAGRTCLSQDSSVLPIRPGRRGAGTRQPVQRDVVEDVVARQVAHRLAIDKGARHLVVA